MSKSYGQQFDEALACETKEEAEVWLQGEIERYEEEFGISPEEAKSTILANLGYMAGYYDAATAVKIRDLFGALHPMLGDWGETPPTAKKAFSVGYEWGKKKLEKERC